MDCSEHSKAGEHTKKTKMLITHKKMQKENIDELVAMNDEQLFTVKNKNEHQEADNLLAKIYDKIKDSVYLTDRKRYYTYLSVYYANLAYFKLM